MQMPVPFITLTCTHDYTWKNISSFLELRNVPCLATEKQVTMNKDPTTLPVTNRERGYKLLRMLHISYIESYTRSRKEKCQCYYIFIPTRRVGQGKCIYYEQTKISSIPPHVKHAWEIYTPSENKGNSVISQPQWSIKKRFTFLLMHHLHTSKLLQEQQEKNTLFW